MSEKARVKKWEDRVRAADKLYDKWSERYNTPRLEDYYLGRQWQGLPEEEAQKRYVINNVFATVETNKPTLVFQNPQVKMSVRPGKADDLGSHAQDRVTLCQDTVQSFIEDPEFGFVEDTVLALHEAHFRFGVIEVGYTADWIDNPDAGKPMLREKDPEAAGGDEADESEPAPMLDSAGQPVMQPDMLVERENLYIKRIPASTYRCSISSKNRVSRNDWVGYYEWMFTEDIKANPAYKKGARGLKPGGVLKRELQDTPEDGEDAETMDQRSGMNKVWKVWDLRKKVKKIFVEGHDKFLLEAEPFNFLPHAVLRFFPVLDSFYPCPPVSQWIGPQDEINETRDAQRAHRQRFYRRYTRMRGAIDDEELEKLETGGDGVVAISNQPNPLQEVPLAPMGGDVWSHLDASKMDLMTVTGVSGDQKGVAESETATQANIIDQHSRLREGSARAKVQTWLAEVAHLILLTIREDMALPFWVKRNVDPVAIPENQGSEVMRVAQLWQEISATELGSSEVDVTIDLSTMSPVAQADERNAWNAILGLLTNPNLMMVLGTSPALLKKTLRLYGITQQTEIAEINKAIEMFLTMQVAAQAAQTMGADAEGKGGGVAAGGSKLPPRPGETPAELQGTMVN